MTELICIICPKGCHLSVDEENGYKVTGASCSRGNEYGKKELTNPTRTITSTVKITGGLYDRLPVKTDDQIKKELVMQAVRLLDDVVVTSPVKVGDVILADILGTGISFVSTRDM